MQQAGKWSDVSHVQKLWKDRKAEASGVLTGHSEAVSTICPTMVQIVFAVPDRAPRARMYLLQSRVTKLS